MHKYNEFVSHFYIYLGKLRIFRLSKDAYTIIIIYHQLTTVIIDGLFTKRGFWFSSWGHLFIGEEVYNFLFEGLFVYKQILVLEY